METHRLYGDSYGLTMGVIEQVAQQGLACVTHMNLEVSTTHCGDCSAVTLAYLTHKPMKSLAFPFSMTCIGSAPTVLVWHTLKGLPTCLHVYNNICIIGCSLPKEDTL